MAVMRQASLTATMGGNMPIGDGHFFMLLFIGDHAKAGQFAASAGGSIDGNKRCCGHFRLVKADIIMDRAAVCG